MKDFCKRLLALGMGAAMIFGMGALAGCDSGNKEQTPTPPSGTTTPVDDDPEEPPVAGKKTLAEAKAELEAFMQTLTTGKNFTYTNRAIQPNLMMEFDGQKLKKTEQGAVTYYDATTQGQTFSYTANQDGWDKEFSDFDIDGAINSIKNMKNSISWKELDQNGNLIGTASVNQTNVNVTAKLAQNEWNIVSKAEVTGQVVDDITIDNIGRTAVVIPTEKINDKTFQESDLLYTEVDGERVWNVKLIADTFMKNLPNDYFNVGSIEYSLEKILYVNVENNTLHIGAYLGGENPCFLAYRTRSQFATSLTSGEMETKDQLINYIKTADYNKPLISEGSLIDLDYATGVDATEEEEQEFAILSQRIVERLVSVGVQPGDIDKEGVKQEELTDGQVIFGCMGPVKNTTAGHGIGNYALFDIILIVKVDDNYKLVKANVCSSTDRVENGKTNVLNNNTNRWLVQKCEIEDLSKENAVLYENTL